ncbi:type III secretion system outer membrane ring subunit SctC [Robbsia sp. KACC 23696]|uniref:type III secretion system outer membrane ring subunit SctC n=1 Tax=Robbsia sp. KACC 23696 TaxID=3149231 RepID=UPI00325B85EA
MKLSVLSPAVGVHALASVSRLWNGLLALAVAGMLLTAHGSPHAAPRWDDAPFTYYANNVAVTKVLQDFARNFSLRLDIDGAVSSRADSRLGARVNGRFNSANPTAFLDQLGSVYGFSWFGYAGVLYISGASDVVTRVVDARGGSIGGLRDALYTLGVLDPRFGWGEMAERGVALVSGPRRYVELVEHLVAQLPSAAGAQEVRVFRLKHASVLDRTIQYRDRSIVTPGLATTLRALIQGDGSGIGGRGNNEVMSALSAPLRGNPPTFQEGGAASSYAPVYQGGGSQALTGLQGGMPPLPPMGLSSAANVASAAGLGQALATGGSRGGASAGNGASGANGTSGEAALQANLPRTIQPSIRADARLNAIIVQDVPDRMPIYQKLIDELDVPTAIVQIEAEIIDVSKSRIQELGINWSARTGNVGIGFGSTTATSAVTGAGLLNAVAGTSGVLSLVGNAGSAFASRLNLLEADGDAKVLASPSILTLDNLGAVMDLSDTVYIQTTGRDVATVTPVTVGTTLNVTPRYVAHLPFGEIELTVDIEDGTILEIGRNGLPRIRKTTIGTQTRLSINEALVIAGYNSSNERLDLQRTPWLSKIPLLGVLFRSRQTNATNTERLFIIRPTMISIPDGPAYRPYGSTSPSPDGEVPTAPSPIGIAVPSASSAQ